MDKPNSIQEALLEIHKGLYPENYEFDEENPGEPTEWDSGTIEWVAGDIEKALKQFDVKGASFEIAEYVVTDEVRTALRQIGVSIARFTAQDNPDWGREQIEAIAHTDAMDEGMDEFEYVEAEEISTLVDEGIATFLNDEWEG